MQLVLAPLHLQQRGVAGLALQQPLAGELRHQLGQVRVQAGAGLAHHLEEHLVAPDHAGVFNGKHRDGQREIHERAALGIFRVIGDGFNIGGQLLCLPAPGNQVEDQQQQDRCALGRGQTVMLQIERRRSEENKEQKRQLSGFGQPTQRLVQS